MLRRTFLLGAAASALPVRALASSSDWILSLLTESVHQGQYCGSQRAAIEGTISRLDGVSLPDDGKVIVVNIPSGVVTAYQDGVPIIESRAVVGMPSTPTPELQTRVTYIRPNPTWTVPESIINRKGWRDRLMDDPGFFEDNGFLIHSGGEAMSPFDAAQSGYRPDRFVQQPGPSNALGLLKIGLHNANAIYLHDTNQPSRYEEDLRAASAGCVRIEHVREIASWIMGIAVEDLNDRIAHADMTDYRPYEPVSVIIGYWTAWPDAQGDLRFYPDIYGWDDVVSDCGSDSQPMNSFSGRSLWREYEAR